MRRDVKFFIPFTKIDEDERIVGGYASTEAEDSQGEIVELKAIKEAWADYWKWANIREMHQLSAVGVGKEYIFDNKGVWITAKIVDDDAWKKVKEGVYKGFSIGGKILEKVGKVIKKLVIDEISIVDRPANPECVFTLIKRDLSPSKKVEIIKKIIIPQMKTIEAEFDKKIEAMYNNSERVGNLEKLNKMLQDTRVLKMEETEEKTEEMKEEQVEQENEQYEEELEESLREFVTNLTELIKLYETKNVDENKIEKLRSALKLLESVLNGEENGENEENEVNEENGEREEVEEVQKILKAELGSLVEKVTSALAKVESKISSLEERVAKIERQPLRKNEPRASYLVDKALGVVGSTDDEVKDPQTIKNEISKIEKEIEKVYDEAKTLITNPNPEKEMKIEKRLRELEKELIEKKLQLRKAVYGI